MLQSPAFLRFKRERQPIARILAQVEGLAERFVIFTATGMVSPTRNVPLHDDLHGNFARSAQDEAKCERETDNWGFFMESTLSGCLIRPQNRRTDGIFAPDILLRAHNHVGRVKRIFQQTASLSLMFCLYATP